MDETSAPWRALEDPAPARPTGSVPATGPAGPAAPGIALIGLPIATLAALGGALILAVIAAVLVLGSGHGAVAIDGASPVDEPAGSNLARPSSGADLLVVDVQGAVVRPGIVELPPGARVGDAIAAAGGYSPRVAADRVGMSLNLAALVRDGDQIVVPSRDDPSGGPPTSTSPGGGPPAGPIDLNRASATELDGLPGIGPATAAKIIAARDEQPFASVDDLRTRKIVGAATFEKIKDLVAVR
jgi:competence protein ComEA